MCLLYYLTVICLVGGASSKSLIAPCKLSNLTCIENSLNDALPRIFDGNPELGIESSDPLYFDNIDVKLPNYNCTLYNSTFVGYKTCKISNLRINEDITIVHGEAKCEHFKTIGYYSMNGSLLTLPIEGNGEFTFSTREYLLIVDLKMEKVKKKDGKTYLVVRDIKSTEEPLNPVEFGFKNLYNGQRDLADVARKFAKENWKLILDYFSGLVWYPIVKIVVTNVGKYFENVALEDIFINE